MKLIVFNVLLGSNPWRDSLEPLEDYFTVDYCLVVVIVFITTTLAVTSLLSSIRVHNIQRRLAYYSQRPIMAINHEEKIKQKGKGIRGGKYIALGCPWRQTRIRIKSVSSPLRSKKSSPVSTSRDLCGSRSRLTVGSKIIESTNRADSKNSNSPASKFMNSSLKSSRSITSQLLGGKPASKGTHSPPRPLILTLLQAPIRSNTGQTKKLDPRSYEKQSRKLSTSAYETDRTKDIDRSKTSPASPTSPLQRPLLFERVALSTPPKNLRGKEDSTKRENLKPKARTCRSIKSCSAQFLYGSSSSWISSTTQPKKLKSFTKRSSSPKKHDLTPRLMHYSPISFTAKEIYDGNAITNTKCEEKIEVSQVDMTSSFSSPRSSPRFSTTSADYSGSCDERIFDASLIDEKGALKERDASTLDHDFVGSDRGDDHSIDNGTDREHYSSFDTVAPSVNHNDVASDSPGQSNSLSVTCGYELLTKMVEQRDAEEQINISIVKGECTAKHLQRRFSSLQLLKELWGNGKATATVQQLYTMVCALPHKEIDVTTVVDFLSTIEMSTTPLDLDASAKLMFISEACLCCSARKASPRTIIVTLALLSTLCEQHGDVIITAQAAVVGRGSGIDLAREMRLQRCKDCLVALERINQKLNNFRIYYPDSEDVHKSLMRFKFTVAPLLEAKSS